MQGINFYITITPNDIIVIRWILVQKNKGKLICDSPNDIISVNFDGEKVDQDGIFNDKDILHFFFESPKHYTY
jgi:hypothetical protein